MIFASVQIFHLAAAHTKGDELSCYAAGFFAISPSQQSVLLAFLLLCGGHRFHSGRKRQRNIVRENESEVWEKRKEREVQIVSCQRMRREKEQIQRQRHRRERIGKQHNSQIEIPSREFNLISSITTSNGVELNVVSFLFALALFLASICKCLKCGGNSCSIQGRRRQMANEQETGGKRGREIREVRNFAKSQMNYSRFLLGQIIYTEHSHISSFPPPLATTKSH